MLFVVVLLLLVVLSFDLVWIGGADCDDTDEYDYDDGDDGDDCDDDDDDVVVFLSTLSLLAQFRQQKPRLFSFLPFRLLLQFLLSFDAFLLEEENDRLLFCAPFRSFGSVFVSAVSLGGGRRTGKSG